MTALSDLKVFATHPHQCSYLDDKEATTLFIDPETAIDVETYTALSEIGFRRSGLHIYKPHCEGCTACIPARIPVVDFEANRQQRKTLRRNAKVVVEEVPTIDTDRCYALYEKYIRHRHADGDMFPPDREQYDGFLSKAFSYTHYFQFSIDNELAAIAVTDQLTHGLSAIYTFFDPDFDRYSLGRYAILWQIDKARELGLPYVYLGYWIKNCSKMAYKSDYRPLELLINNHWKTLK